MGICFTYSFTDSRRRLRDGRVWVDALTFRAEKKSIIRLKYVTQHALAKYKAYESTNNWIIACGAGDR